MAIWAKLWPLAPFWANRYWLVLHVAWPWQHLGHGLDLLRSVVTAWIFPRMIDASDTNTGCMSTRQHQQIATRNGVTKLLSQQGHLIRGHRSLNLHLEHGVTSQMLQETLNGRLGHED